MLIVHWIGCIWYLLVGKRDSWLPPKDLDAGKTTFYDLNISGKYYLMFYYGLLLIFGNDSAPTTTP